MGVSSDERLIQLRRAAFLLLGTLLIFGWMPRATAATPAFALAVEAQGSSVEVTVTLLQSIPSSIDQFEASGVLDRLIGAVPANEVDENGRPLPGSDPVVVPLEPVESGVTYQGRVALDDGEWALFPWPDSPNFNPSANPGAPATEFVTVEGPFLPPVLIGIVALLALVIGGLVLASRRNESKADTAAQVLQLSETDLPGPA